MPSGKGQDRPAPSTRFNVSRTVERARPSRRAISCVDTDEDFSRIISRASRIPIRSAGIDPPLGLPKGRPDQANGSARQSTKDPGGIIPLWGARSSRNRGAASFRYRWAASSRNWGAASSGISTDIGFSPQDGCRHPANAVLNYLYGVLASELTIALTGVGLDAGLGIFHTDTARRASLIYDAMEAVRPGVDC